MSSQQISRPQNLLAVDEEMVETIDLNESAGQGQQERDIEVIHQIHQSGKPATTGSLLTGAVVSVVNTLQSAKEAITGGKKQ
ncbi:uncharacterized protein LOC130824035 [Amaranthus tricolor]|uniref:uncharacterized protein LOC130824035 n=1 Tax=Amaranthus tricolor TaxID=29722 RepID=UPI0025884F08|nr:uncharacterized protein LOC130824035 [Amaranthus tricolor]